MIKGVVAERYNRLIQIMNKTKTRIRLPQKPAQKVSLLRDVLLPALLFFIKHPNSRLVALV